MSPREVGVLGLWHLGLVTCAGLLERGHRIVAADPDHALVSDLKAGRLPVAEPGLAEAWARGLADGKLTVTASLEALSAVEVAWLTVDTRLRPDGGPDIEDLDQTVNGVPGWPRVLLVSSQVPVGYCGALLARLRPRGCSDIGYVPENLRLGHALADFATPDLLTVGCSAPKVAETVEGLIGAPLHACKLETAELTKHAVNSLLATLITFGNGLGDVAEEVGADGREVADLLRRDRRFSPNLPLLPGPAFFGGTLARDLVALRDVAGEHGVHLPLLDSVVLSNVQRTGALVDRLSRSVPLEGATVVLLGYVYKDGTDAMRDAPGAQFEHELTERGATVRVFEPAVAPGNRPQAWYGTWQAAASGADAMIMVRPRVLTETEITELVLACPDAILLDLWAEMRGDLSHVIVPGVGAELGSQI